MKEIEKNDIKPSKKPPLNVSTTGKTKKKKIKTQHICNTISTVK